MLGNAQCSICYPIKVFPFYLHGGIMRNLSNNPFGDIGIYLSQRFTFELPLAEFPFEFSNNIESQTFLHEYTHLVQNLFSVVGWFTLGFEALKLQ